MPDIAALTSKNHYIDELQCRCEDAAGGYYDEAKRQALLEEIDGAFSFIPVAGDAVKKAVREKNFNKLRGVLVNFYEPSAPNSSTNVDVRTTTHQSVNVDTSIDNAMAQMWSLPDVVLSSEQKQELAKLIQGVEDAKGSESKLKKAGKALANWLFDQGIKAVPTVMPYLTQAVQSIVSG